MKILLAVVLVLGLSAPVALAEERLAPATPVADGEARSTVTICVDRVGRQCWTVLGRVRCRSASRPTAEVFAVVAAEGPEEHLLRCMQSLQP